MLAKRQKLFGIVFCLAVGGLLADRLFILPHSADAQEDKAEEPPEAALMLDTADTPLGASKTQRVAERLESLCPSERILKNPLPDAFTLPAPWLADVDPNGSLLGRSDRVAEFKSRYELLAVAENSGEYCAFINHHRLRVGQVLNGFTLVAVDEDSVAFEGDDLRFELRLKSGR